MEHLHYEKYFVINVYYVRMNLLLLQKNILNHIGQSIFFSIEQLYMLKLAIVLLTMVYIYLVISQRIRHQQCNCIKVVVTNVNYNVRYMFKKNWVCFSLYSLLLLFSRYLYCDRSLSLLKGKDKIIKLIFIWVVFVYALGRSIIEYNTFKSHTLYNPPCLIKKSFVIGFLLLIRLYYSNQSIYAIQNTLSILKYLIFFVVRF